MNGEPLDDLAVAYDELVARAVGAELLPAATGWTLREQAVRLGAAGRLPAADVARLAELIEGVRHGGRADDGARAEARQLCGHLSADLPEAPPHVEQPGQAEPEPDDDSLSGRWMDVVEPYLMPLMLTVAVVLMVVLIAQGGGGFASGGGGGGGSSGGGFGSSGGSHGGRSVDFAAELSAIRSAQGSWSRSPSKVSMRTMSASTRVARTTTGPGFDLNTGTDGRYIGRSSVRCTPDLGPTHRLFVYDAVGPGYRFLRPVGDLADALGDGEDASESVRLEADVVLLAHTPVPLPSAAPDAEVLFVDCDEDVSLEVLKDSADGLHVVADKSVRATITTVQATVANYHFAPVPDEPWQPVAADLPDDVRAGAELVLERIGDLPQPSFAGTVRRLQAYFGGFSVAPLRPDEIRDDPFVTVALARKGVCRHRARSFVVCALALGLQARLVENITHSFAEVRLPNGDWRRIELRLGTGEQPPVPHTAAARRAGAWADGGPSIGAVLTTLLAVAVLVVLIARRDAVLAGAHLLQVSAPEVRPWRRARRDHELAQQRQAVDRLLDTVHERLAARLGHDADDLQGLGAAIEELDVEHNVKQRLRNALHLAAERGSAARPDASNLQFAYWNSYHVLRWVEGSRPW